VIFTVRVAPDGSVKLDGAERAVVRSRAKLAYDSVRDSDLPPDFADLAKRIQGAEDRRGAARVDPPEQEVDALGDGRYALTFRPLLQSEISNAAMSLATNLAIADALQAHHTGLFRVMAPPNQGAVERLRHTARAYGLKWPGNETLDQFSRGLDGGDAKQAAFMLAIRRAGQGASYVPYQDGVVPWHAAMAATYCHATAPLRRLADRYVVRATLAIAKGEAVPAVVSEAFTRLPQVMAHADQLDGQIGRAVIDLAEAVMLQGSVAQIFQAVVTDVDDRGARIQLWDQPVVARVAAQSVGPGDAIGVRLTAADPATRAISFERVS
jgi:exoribonuclease R